jgi:hypothetical protein
MPWIAPQWVGGVAFVLVATMTIVSWCWLQPHLLATSSIKLRGGAVFWDWDNGSWRHGGSTTVDFSSSAAPLLKDADLDVLPNLKHVVGLQLGNCAGITDEGLAVLRKLPDLEQLDLGRSPEFMQLMLRTDPPLTEVVIDHVKGLVRLKDLSLAQAKITDAGLAKLKNLRNLESLDLSGTLVTNAGLQVLKGMPRLRLLIVDSPGITPEGSAFLLETNPNLDIQHPHVAYPRGQAQFRVSKP